MLELVLGNLNLNAQESRVLKGEEKERVDDDSIELCYKEFAGRDKRVHVLTMGRE